MNNKTFEYKPFQRYVTSTVYGYTGYLVQSYGGTRWIVKAMHPGALVEADGRSLVPVLNVVPDYWCKDCYDTGMISPYGAISDFELCGHCPVIALGAPYRWTAYVPWCFQTDKFIPDNATPPF